MTAPRSLVVAVATAAGVLAGWALSRRYLDAHQRALFSSGPTRRHAAIGYLAGHPSPDNLRVLRDYVAWERHPRLRRRAERVIRRLEAAIA